MKGFEHKEFSVHVDETSVEVSVLVREGSGEPIVFLHGFGSAKEDFADIIQYSAFNGQPFLAYDAPGCGQTECEDLSKVDIPFLVNMALAMLAQVEFERFHLVGHSMGGLTALMLAHQVPERVISFTSIEGNVAPEDCFLSRQIVEFAHPDDDAFFNAFIARIRHSSSYASALYSASLHHKVRSGAVRGIFTSMVELSDYGNLMDKFLGLPCPKMFMYGEQNRSLSYLANIQENGVRLAEISSCGHFPMYSNPLSMWQELDEFIHQLNG